jgi:hypothetical protein
MKLNPKEKPKMMTAVEKQKLIEDLRPKLKRLSIEAKPRKKGLTKRKNDPHGLNQGIVKGRRASHMATLPMKQRAIVEKHEEAICAIMETFTYAECTKIANILLFASWREANRGKTGVPLRHVRRLARLYLYEHPQNPTEEIKEQMRILDNPTHEFLCRCDDLIDEHDLFCERAFKGLPSPRGKSKS